MRTDAFADGPISTWKCRPTSDATYSAYIAMVTELEFRGVVGCMSRCWLSRRSVGLYEATAVIDRTVHHADVTGLIIRAAARYPAQIPADPGVQRGSLPDPEIPRSRIAYSVLLALTSCVPSPPARVPRLMSHSIAAARATNSGSLSARQRRQTITAT